ncbi:MAG: biopolymer transporter ExbD [Chromatiaceae bacterium]|nr:MAG: biopolymer transporter ExbD [Chromatiaceae bacterium]
MNLRPHRTAEPEINLTPLIDVVFLLLIFFMVSTSFKEDARLRLQLPEAEGEAVSAEEIDLLEILIDRQGRTFVAEQEVGTATARGLQQAMVAAVAGRRDLPVLIRADANTPHQAVMRALDAAVQVGLNRIAFAASRPEIGVSGRSASGGPGGGAGAATGAASSPPPTERAGAP